MRKYSVLLQNKTGINSFTLTLTLQHYRG